MELFLSTMVCISSVMIEEHQPFFCLLLLLLLLHQVSCARRHLPRETEDKWPHSSLWGARCSVARRLILLPLPRWAGTLSCPLLFLSVKGLLFPSILSSSPFPFPFSSLENASHLPHFLPLSHGRSATFPTPSPGPTPKCAACPTRQRRVFPISLDRFYSSDHCKLISL